MWMKRWCLVSLSSHSEISIVLVPVLFEVVLRTEYTYAADL